MRFNRDEGETITRTSSLCLEVRARLNVSRFWYSKYNIGFGNSSTRIILAWTPFLRRREVSVESREMALISPLTCS